MYLVGKMFKMRIFLWFCMELQVLPKKALIPSEFVLFGTCSDSSFNVFYFYIHVQSFPSSYCREPFLFSL